MREENYLMERAERTAYRRNLLCHAEPFVGHPERSEGSLRVLLRISSAKHLSGEMLRVRLRMTCGRAQRTYSNFFAEFLSRTRRDSPTRGEPRKRDGRGNAARAKTAAS